MPPQRGYGFNSLEGVPDDYRLLSNEVDKNEYLISYTIHYIGEHPLSSVRSIPVKTALLAYPFDMKWLIPSFPFKYNCEKVKLNSGIECDGAHCRREQGSFQVRMKQVFMFFNNCMERVNPVS